MTEEEIARLRALAVDLLERNLNLRHAAGIEELTQGESTPADSLLRLIEERQRLLEALKHASEAFELSCGYSQLQKWIDAITFAEEPI